MYKLKTRTLVTLFLFGAIFTAFLLTPNVSSQSAVVTTTTTITQPAAGQCTEISFAFLGEAHKEIAGSFGADASISFYVLSPADFTAIQNPTCTLPPSSRPLYSQLNIAGTGNPYRSLPFPANGTYYFVFVLANPGTSNIVSGHANAYLSFPPSTTLVASGASLTQISSSSLVPTTQSASQGTTRSVAQNSVQTTAQIAAQITAQSATLSQALVTTVASAAPPIGTLAVVGVIVVVALIASVMVFMKRGKMMGGQKAVLKQETVKEELEPEAKAEVKPEARPAAILETKSQASQAKQDNISTGYPELDSMLAGGLPIGYAILIVSPPCDERDLLFRKIIESSQAMGSPIFFLSRDLIRTQDFATRYKEDFHVFSPQADKLTPAGGNIFKIQGLQNLSDLNISFTKAVEGIPKKGPGKLVIIDLLSDVLLEHKALMTRKWLDGFIGKRKTEGFTIIGVLNPLLSSQQDTQTIMDLFDGIIEIYERELKERARRFLIVKKMYGRRYSDTELMLDKDKLY